jgi:hypothetical protein
MKIQQMLLNVLMIAIVFLVANCSSALELQVRSVAAAQPLIEQAHHEIMDARGEAMLEAAQSEGTEEEVRARTTAVSDRYAPLLTVYEVVENVYNEWLALLDRAVNEDEGIQIEQIEEIAQDFMMQFNNLRMLGRSVGLNINELSNSEGIESNGRHRILVEQERERGTSEEREEKGREGKGDDGNGARLHWKTAHNGQLSDTSSGCSSGSTYYCGNDWRLDFFYGKRQNSSPFNCRIAKSPPT